MAAKRIAMSTIKQLIRFHHQKRSKKFITRSLGLSKNTIKKYLKLIDASDMTLEQLLEIDESTLEQVLINPPNKLESDRYKSFKGQTDYLLKELERRHVTRRQLWIEYKKTDPGGYEYSQFCYHLQQLGKAKKVSMVMSHEPGDKLYVDFAGDTWDVWDRSDRQPSQKQVFVATLGYSQYGYVEAVDSQKSEDLIAVLNRCLQYYGGVPKGIVTDNMKTAVIKTDRYEPKLNKILEDFANHYGTAIIPTRSAKPKDKAHVENVVKHTYNQIYGPLRDRKFYDLYSLNEAIREKLEEYNNRTFQGRNYSRHDRFVAEEKPVLSSLPSHTFLLKKYRRVRVQKNRDFLLKEDHHYYSVPYAYIGTRIKVIYTHNTVSAYFKTRLIASHVHNKRPYGYTTIAIHLPSHFQDYQDRSPKYYLDWAASQTPQVLEIIQKIFSVKQHPEQAYRTCDGIKHLSRRVDKDIFNKACLIAVEYKCYQYSFIKTLIENGMTHQILEPPANPQTPVVHDNIRGKQYYQNQ